MACLENAILNHMRTTKQYLRTGTKGQISYQKNVKAGKGQSNTDKAPKLPKLPKGKCVPGKTYSKGCKKCFCNNKQSPICTKSCIKKTLLSKRLFEEDILAFEMTKLINSPQLKHMGMECVPGESYNIQCNLCFCSDKRDLYCTMKYCLNVESYSEAVLVKYNGQSCDKDYRKHCVSCMCKDKISSCKLLKNCNKLLSGKQMLSDGTSIVKLALDVKKDKCAPNVTYKAYCNDCYCQPEGGLRCTQKVCLTFTQIKDLQKREAYLEKHGL